MAPAGAAPRVQPPERVAAHRHRASPGRSFNFVFAVLRVRGTVHVRPARGAPGARRAAAGQLAAAAGLHARRHGARGRRRARHHLAGAALAPAAGRAAARGACALEVQDRARQPRRRDASTCAAFRPTTSKATSSERVGLRLYRPPLEPVIGQVVAGGPAERAGLAPGDRIVRADGKPHRDLGRRWSANRSARTPARPLAARRRARRHDARARRHARERGAGRARASAASAPGRVPPAHADKMLITACGTGSLGSLGKAVREDLGHLGLQPEDARPDADRRGVVEEPLRPGHDRRLRRPVGAARAGSPTSASSPSSASAWACSTCCRFRCSTAGT